MTNPIPWKQIAELAETVVNGDDPSIHARFEARAKLGNALDPATVLQMVAEHAAVRGALAELVACRDLKELGARACSDPAGTFGDCQTCQARVEYNKRAPIAWTAARAALTGGEP